MDCYGHFVSEASCLLNRKKDHLEIVSEVYEALKAAGIGDDLARRAAHAVLPRERESELVTRPVLRAELADLKAELIKWNVGTILATSAVVAAIVRLLQS
jgi:hypothetical protein